MFQIAIDFQIIILIICHPASFLWLSSGSLKTFPCRAPHKRLIFSVSIGGGELRQHNAGGDSTSSSAPGRDTGPSRMSCPCPRAARALCRLSTVPGGDSSWQLCNLVSTSLGRNLLESGEPKRAQLLLKAPVSLSSLAQKAPDESQPLGLQEAPALLQPCCWHWRTPCGTECYRFIHHFPCNAI